MPMFYFNVISASGAILDFEGTELPDIEAARVEAIEDARALMSTAVLEGRDISSRRIDICNEAGEILLTIGFTDAISRFD